ncbi:MAG: hypothetical protein LBC27_04140, partial [Spirochaetaceae bacterium]|nr:hypothetical protein [Spirochaetaceae bacterium]
MTSTSKGALSNREIRLKPAIIIRAHFHAAKAAQKPRFPLQLNRTAQNAVLFNSASIACAA